MWVQGENKNGEILSINIAKVNYIAFKKDHIKCSAKEDFRMLREDFGDKNFDKLKKDILGAVRVLNIRYYPIVYEEGEKK